jgi:hypothetical protein
MPGLSVMQSGRYLHQVGDGGKIFRGEGPVTFCRRRQRGMRNRQRRNRGEYRAMHRAAHCRAST